MANARNLTETAIEWGSAVLLAVATGFFAWALVTGVDAEMALAAAMSAALAGFVAALALLKRAGSACWPRAAFALSPIVPLVRDSADEPDDSGELLLTDALPGPDEQSRVLRLFAPETLDVPGELATRIDQWLDGARSRLETRGDEAAAEAPSGHGHGPSASPASAALHSALADIRRSLG